MSARREVHFEGVFYDDIDWSKPVHKLPPECPICSGDNATGHQNACPYMWSQMQSPRGRQFLRNMIRDALLREKEAEKSK